MLTAAHIRPAYSRAERISDGVVHVVGLTLALLAVPALITFTALYRSDPAAILGTSIYGTTLILMLGCSALYNMNETVRWAGLLQRLDHSAIYVKIAGTYTPFMLLSGAPVTGLLAGLWGSAAFGTVLKIVAPTRFRWFALLLYLAMGWAGVFAGGAMLAELPWSVLTLMIGGGVVYTAGVMFFLFKGMLFHNTIWHVFVLAGSVLFFVAVSLSIAGLPTGTP